MNSLASQYNLRHEDNPVVFFDVSIGINSIACIFIGGFAVGRIKMELFADVVPKVKKVSSVNYIFRPLKTSGNYARENLR